MEERKQTAVAAAPAVEAGLLLLMLTIAAAGFAWRRYGDRGG